MVGINHIGFGFDFCDFLSSDTTASFQGGESASAQGLEDASKVPHLVELLIKKGCKIEDIEKIAYGNMERIIKNTLNNKR